MADETNDNENEQQNPYVGLLPALRWNLRENACVGCEYGGCGGAFSEEQLLTLLAKHGGNVRAASYEGLLIKAENDAVRLPDGITLPDRRDYWLGLAGLYRPSVAHNLPRADESASFIR